MTQDTGKVRLRHNHGTANWTTAPRIRRRALRRARAESDHPPKRHDGPPTVVSGPTFICSRPEAVGLAAYR